MDADFQQSHQFSQFVIKILKKFDKQLASKLAEIEMPPYFFVSWFLSWFSHDFTSFSRASQVFDALVILPPSAVGYFSAVLIHAARDQVLEFAGDSSSESFGMLHQRLKRLPVESWRTHMITDAYRLMLKYPPSTLLPAELSNSAFMQDLSKESELLDWSTVRFIVIPLLLLVLAYLFMQYEWTSVHDS